MKKFLIAVVVIGIAAFQIFKYTDNKAFESNSRQRVQKMFDSLKTGQLADEQDAIGYWNVGHPEAASEFTTNMFGKFRSECGIGKIDSFEIVSATMDKGTDSANRHMDFVCKLNGKELKLRAYHKKPLEKIA